MVKSITRYIDIFYFIKLLIVFCSLYYFNLFYLSITDPKGQLYSSILDGTLNYISWMRNSILYASNVILHFLGYNSYVELPYQLRLTNGSYVQMVYSCIGLGIISFWVAFVAVNNGSIKRKIAWCTLGILAIWFINSWRVALLLIALDKKWKVNEYLDHHTLYNIISYSLIILMAFLFVKENREENKVSGLRPISTQNALEKAVN